MTPAASVLRKALAARLGDGNEMTANTNLVLRQVTLPTKHYVGDDDILLPSNAINMQALAHPIRSEVVRITSAPANASMILREGDAGTAAPLTFVLNDSANQIVVFCAPGENLNGSTNGSLTIAAAQAAYFIRVDRTRGGPDWRAGTIS